MGVIQFTFICTAFFYNTKAASKKMHVSNVVPGLMSVFMHARVFLRKKAWNMNAVMLDWPCWSAVSRKRTVLSPPAHYRWCRPRRRSWCAYSARTALRQRESKRMVRDRVMQIKGRLKIKCECPHCQNSWCPPQTPDEGWTRPSVGVNRSSPIPRKTSAASVQTLHLFTRVKRHAFIDNVNW